ncbi:MAG: multicopper oxidase domain-containing protein [Mycobacterium gordonae]|nr:multicopper oxidase domain-containing protein [Mycobacterium gordonae]
MSSDAGVSARHRALAAKAKRWVLIAFVAFVGVVGLAFAASFAYPHVRAITYVNEGVVSDHRLAIPPLLEPAAIDGEKVFFLTARKGGTELRPGALSDTAGYNGTFLGPTIRVHKGEHVRFQIKNELGEDTTVHWHGMKLPAAMDGGPHQPIAAGATWSPHWTVDNAAATLWYHPHTMGKTAKQVYSGLAGLFIVDDANSDALALPKTYGINDIPLIVQDRDFDAEGRMTYTRNRAQENFGAMGHSVLVNGTYGPYRNVPQNLIRLRILNGSNARRYNFGFSDGRRFHQIATDGGFLDAPVERTQMLLGPGERAEIVVDMSVAHTPVSLMSFAVTGAAPMYHLMRAVTVGENDEYQRFKILELRPTEDANVASQLPAQLNTIERVDPRDASRTRVFRLTDRMSINGRAMDHSRVDEVVSKGATEIWEIDNREALFYHPFHIHAVQFQILSRKGRPPGEYERGWKDTVIVEPFEIVRVMVRFADYADPHLPYMYHCHILEHEDMGMMGQFVVVEDPGADVAIVSPLIGATRTHEHGQ